VKKIVAVSALAAAFPLVIPAAAHAGTSLPTGPACVVVNGPNGLHVQVGYAPTGPKGCTPLP